MPGLFRIAMHQSQETVLAQQHTRSPSRATRTLKFFSRLVHVQSVLQSYAWLPATILNIYRRLANLHIAPKSNRHEPVKMEAWHETLSCMAYKKLFDKSGAAAVRGFLINRFRSEYFCSCLLGLAGFGSLKLHGTIHILHVT